MSNMITPTVGRKGWYGPSKHDQTGPIPMCARPGQPLDATVLAVWGDRCINVLVLDIYGKPFPKTSVTLLQDGDVVPRNAEGEPTGGYVEWMPYQTLQSAKHATKEESHDL
jgi:hypothetical protein